MKNLIAFLGLLSFTTVATAAEFNAEKIVRRLNRLTTTDTYEGTTISGKPCKALIMNDQGFQSQISIWTETGQYAMFVVNTRNPKTFNPVSEPTFDYYTEVLDFSEETNAGITTVKVATEFQRAPASALYTSKVLVTLSDNGALYWLNVNDLDCGDFRR